MDVILAELALIAGAVYTGIQKAYAYTLAFVAGAFLVVAEALKEADKI